MRVQLNEMEEVLRGFGAFSRIFQQSDLAIQYSSDKQVEMEEVLSGLEGLWSQGVLLREALMDKL